MKEESALSSTDRFCSASTAPCPRPPEDGSSALLAEIAAKVHTINRDTGLSTDFLNQYNELSMLLDLAADDQDMLEELEDWAPRTYQEHFAASGFKDWALVVEAYDLCPAAIRAEFNAAIGVLNSVATAGVGSLLAAMNAGSAIEPETVHALAAEVQAAIVHASGLINGSSTLGSQAQVDTLFARAQAELGMAGAAPNFTPPNPPSRTESGDTATNAQVAADDEMLDQDAIDALFD